MKKQYRITLFKGHLPVCEKMAVLAAIANGGDNENFTLEELRALFRATKIEYPNAYANSQCEHIGEHTLHVDTKVDGEYKTVLIIEEIEVSELKTFDELHEELLN